MSNQKAQKKVDNALKVFDTAIKEIHGANNILDSEIKKDEESIASMNAKIDEYKERIKEFESSKKSKADDIRHNQTTLENLRQFKQGGN